ncbi:hypothetical protein JW766_05695 [Candidatus Dojkabacteria bacterium]|nr:hypothetical protein [Candidatus Dojkabacteria bacterium]
MPKKKVKETETASPEPQVVQQPVQAQQVQQQPQPQVQYVQPAAAPQPVVIQQKSSNSCLIIFLIVAAIGVLLLCCCSSVAICGFMGSLPEFAQNYYDEGNWVWDEYLEENTSLKKYPTGDVETWWWTATDEQRQNYIEKNGYPSFLYGYTWDQDAWANPDWYSSDVCTFPNGDVETWWYSVSEDMRNCYTYLYGLPSFLYEGDWESSYWYSDDACTFPNGDIETWWWTVSDQVRDCYVWTYGMPDFLYPEDYYYDDSYDYDYYDNYDLSCVYQLDCDYPNGDLEFWFDDAPEAQKACVIYQVEGMTSFWAENGCSYPNGDIEYWWCSTDEDTRLCYINEYGLPWFME